MWDREEFYADKACNTCREDFTPKYEWQEQCWKCFLRSPKGKAWKARKDAEQNGFHRSYDDDDDERERHEDYKRDHAGKFRSATPDEEASLDKKLLQKLIMLCHPDKHGGSTMSNEVTKELLAMKERMK